MYTSALPTDSRQTTCARAVSLKLVNSAGLTVSEPPQPANSTGRNSIAIADIAVAFIAYASNSLRPSERVELHLHDRAVGALLRQLVQRLLVCGARLSGLALRGIDVAAAVGEQTVERVRMLRFQQA